MTSDASSTRPPLRQRLTRFVDSTTVQNAVLVVIVINAITIGLQTAFSEGTRGYELLGLLDHAALAIFVVELVIKLIGYGPKRFFSDGWCVFDFIVVAIALVPASGSLSVLRALRVLRVLRVIKFLPQVRMLVEALLRAIPGIGAIALLISLVFYVSAVMSTVMFGENFPEWFGDIGKSLYSLFQIMTLESWSMGIVRPVMEQTPWAWLFFVPFILISAFVTLNLFIGVIVDTMQSLREEREDLANADENASLSPEPEHGTASLSEQEQRIIAAALEQWSERYATIAESRPPVDQAGSHENLRLAQALRDRFASSQRS